MQTVQTSIYVHGSAPEEQRRLARLNALLNDACLRELKWVGGYRILDVGSGLGQFSRAMARSSGPTGKVVGIERSPEQLAQAQRLAVEDRESSLVEFRQGDALALPLRPEEWATFDLAHARFLLEHVSDPLAVVRAMVAAVRPGGRIVLADDDHDILRLSPDLPAFMPLWVAYMRSYERLGNDPFVGRRLVSLLHQAGATPVRSTWLFFGSCAAEPVFSALVENMLHILHGARSAILPAPDFDAAAFDAGIEAFKAWSGLPDAAFWYALCWAEGARR